MRMTQGCRLRRPTTTTASAAPPSTLTCSESPARSTASRAPAQSAPMPRQPLQPLPAPPASRPPPPSLTRTNTKRTCFGDISMMLPKPIRTSPRTASLTERAGAPCPSPMSLRLLPRRLSTPRPLPPLRPRPLDCGRRAAPYPRPQTTSRSASPTPRGPRSPRP